MRLSVLTVELSDETKIPQNDKNPFRFFAHHIKEIFLALFPRNISVNNSSKIAIEFGIRGNEPKFNNELGVTNWFIEEFNFNGFYLANDYEKEIILLENIKDALIDIIKNYSMNNNAIEQIINTSNKVIENKFSLEIEIKKLSKITLDKKYRINIYRVLNKEAGEGWKIVKTDRKTSMIVEENWMINIPNYLDKTDFYKRAEINRNEYILKNYLGDIVYKINV